MSASFKFTPLLAAKIVGSTIMGLMGILYLNRGRDEQDVRQMIKGAALVLLSFFLFF